MKVRTYGFELSVEGVGVTLKDFKEYLQERQNEQLKKRNQARHLYINNNKHEDYSVGLVLTIKDQKTFCKLTQNDDEMTIQVENLGEKSKLMDFNFFALHKDSNMGVYQHYANSCSLGTLFDYLCGLFNKLRQDRIDNALMAAAAKNEHELSEKKKSEIRKLYKCSLKTSQLLTQSSLAEMLAEVSRIKAYSYDVVAIGSDKGNEDPIYTNAVKIRERILFEANNADHGLIQRITNHVKRRDPDSGMVETIDMNNQERNFKIFNTPNTYNEQNYDVLAATLRNIKIKEFYDCKVADDLIEVMEKHDMIFTAQG